MNAMSVTPGLLIEYARTHRDDAAVARTMAGYLSRLKIPAVAWGELPFAVELDERWSAANESRAAELDRLGGRLSGAPQWLRRAAGDFVASDADAARRLRAAAESHADLAQGDGADSSFVDGQLDAGRGSAGVEATLAEIAATTGLPRLAEPPADRESPGSEELMSCRAEHLTTLERAEGLLREHGQLDFAAPSEFLRQLATVRPGVVGGRAEPLSTLAGYVTGMGDRLVADVARLSEHWEGETAVAFGDHTATTAAGLTGSGAELSRLSSEAEAVWRLLDTLMHDVAGAVWSQVAAVGDSRIARIRAAVDLVDDVNGFAADTDATVLWGGLSGDEVDAAVEVLYKRVWYLSNAMTELVNVAREGATRLADDPRHPPDDE